MKGHAVSVELTGLKKAVSNYENFAHCWMDGDIVSHDEKKGTVMIRLRQRVGKVFTLPADSERIQSAREETLNHFWQKGDEVHVRETNGGKVGWWAATIVSEPKFGDAECTVRWKGAYNEHDNESKVKFADLRLAKEPVENNEKQEASEEAVESAKEKDDREHGDEADESDGEDDNDGDSDKKKSSVKRERPKKNKKKSESATDVKKGKKS